MLKLIGMIMIIMTTSLIGTNFSGALTQRVKRLKNIEIMFDTMATLIKFKAATTGEILSELAKDATFDDLIFIHNARSSYEDSNPFPQAWKDGVDSDISLKDDEKQLLFSAGRSLGTSDCDGQLSMLEIYRHNIAGMYERAKEESVNKGRLYRSLGVLTGVFISVMLV